MMQTLLMKGWRAGLTAFGIVGLLGGGLWADDLSVQDESDPFYVDHQFPKLTSPQWVGDSDVDAVVVLAIDDMREPEKYESYLRPILNRLKAIDGKGHVSIMTNAIDPAKERYQSWLEEGVTIEVHTLTHPCPLLSRNDFEGAENTYFGGIDLLNHVPGNVPVAYRMPCCDSINSPSPRFYAELFNRTNPAGQFLQIDSSVMCSFTSADPALPREWVLNEAGEERFQRYLPFESFVTTIENYPYPYVIGKLCWEFPCMVPSDWEAQNIQGNDHPDTVRDWKRALDLTVLKQGVFNLVFHPHGWIRSDQVIELIDYAQERYGNRVKFMNFEEALASLNEHLLGGQALRRPDGGDNGVRLVDLNRDGYLDVVVGNGLARMTRVWHPNARAWEETGFPTDIVASADGSDRGVRLLRLGEEAETIALIRNESDSGAWVYRNQAWQPAPAVVHELRWDGQSVATRREGRDVGFRVRDFDQDGQSEVFVSNSEGASVLRWEEADQTWREAGLQVPTGIRAVDEAGRDTGLRFVDLNGDGYDDLIQSNPQQYSLHLYIPQTVLGFVPGWSREVVDRQRGPDGAGIPLIVRDGPHPNNGAWFHSRHLWIQNEATAALPDLVERRSFDALLAGEMPAAQSPEASMTSMELDDSLAVELVASEPLIADPVAFDWSPDGRLWVVEMGDYPSGSDGQGRPGGRVQTLTDEDGDGRYDSAVTFLEGLNFPTGVMAVRDGVLVSAAPEIFFAEDRDGDGRADYRETWFTGFNEGNQQHRVNGFEYGLDHWVYGANGDSGGVIQGRHDGVSVSISRRDFRFDLDGVRFETVEGQTQFGRRRDDWGNWFGNNNPNWLWHYWFPERYLRHNPHLGVSGNKRYLGRNDPHVYSVGTMLQRFNDVGHSQHVTSGNSPTPYRDRLFDGAFANSVFVSEPVHNVIHREALTRDGVSFTSRRAPGEERREFLASRDRWFRPTGMRTGPDGALYFADMYRLVIEHPEWIPDDVAAAIDLRSGADLGRIYRVRPKGRPVPPIPNLAIEGPRDWVARLQSVNGWVRDTAQRLLIEHQANSMAPQLRALVSGRQSPQTVVQALWTLSGLDELSEADVVIGLRSDHPEVRRNAVRLAEPWIAGQEIPEALRGALEALVSDGDAAVRFQLALSLSVGSDSEIARIWLRLARQETSSDLRQALECGMPHHLVIGSRALAESSDLTEGDAWLLERFAYYAVFERKPALIRPLVSAAFRGLGEGSIDSMAFVRDYFEALRRAGLKGDPEYDVSRRAPGQSVALVEAMAALSMDAATIVLDRERSIADRLIAWQALAVLKPAVLPWDAVLSFDEASEFQVAVLRSASREWRVPVSRLVRRSWASLRPEVRAAFVNQFVRDEAALIALVSDVKAGEWEGLLDLPGIRQLLARSDDERLVALRGGLRLPQHVPTQELLEAVFDRTADPLAGRAVFEQNCAVCHAFDGLGQAVGPDLRAVSDRSTKGLLQAIVEPNRAVEAKFVTYSIDTKGGDAYTGVVEAESTNNITVRLAGGQQVTVLRREIESLQSSGMSLMPEGLGEQIGAQGLADLIAFLQQ